MKQEQAAQVRAVTPIEALSLGLPSHMFSNNSGAGLCLCSMPGRVTVFNTGGKIRPVSNFMELHTLTEAAISCTLLRKRMLLVV